MRQQEIPAVLPVFPTRGFVVFPFTTVPLVVKEERICTLLQDVSMGDRLVALAGVRQLSDEDGGDLKPNDLHSVGTLGYIVRLFRSPDKTMQVLIQGQDRLALGAVVSTNPYFRMRVSREPDFPLVPNDIEGEAMMRAMAEQFVRLVSLSTSLPDELALNASRAEDPRQLVYVVASALTLEPEIAQEILATTSVKDKIVRVTEILAREIEVLELGKKILSETKSKIDKTQREYVLRQQLKSIQAELGEGEGEGNRADEFRKKIEEVGMPAEALEEAKRELKRLASVPAGSPELPQIEGYLEWLTSLPWNETTADLLGIDRAREVLDEDHYDLREIKDRILEYLAVRKLRKDRHQGEQIDQPAMRPEREGAILCFVGPPGVGKTSLGFSIARALGRKFVRMSLGGLHDEAEIRGHRRTYIGAVPGRIIQSMRRSGSRNPVFMLDEVDKVGVDWRGDPASALLEVLDPEQNRDFRDNYLNVPFDLSQVLFITTANILDTIPAPLRDRMEVLELSGYTQQEKLFIAKQYLLPRQIRENGIRPEEISFSDEALLSTIEEYTREAGVRELERRIGQMCRKVAVTIAGGEGIGSTFVVDAAKACEILGKPSAFHEAKERADIPGVAIGVAVTVTGGDIMFVEATRMKGNKGFSLTGQLGDVMKESAQAALSLVRSKAERLGIPDDFFEKNDIHVHVPAGATPKDGPSAGVTVATALASLATGRHVRPEVSMSGEVTLRGKVLPVGGIKEKAIAVHRAGLDTFIIPGRNERDIEDLPEEVRRDLHIVKVDDIEDVFEHALEGLEADEHRPRVLHEHERYASH